MKKIVTCFAILAMMSAMVSCGSVDSASESSSTRPTSPSTSASSGTTAASDANGTIAAGEKASGGNAAGNSENSKAGTNNGNTAPAESAEASGASPVTKSELMQIMGIWYEENVLDSRTLTVDGDGTYKLSYRGGGSESGNVQIERQVLGDDDVTNIWYCFYKEDGTLWNSFRLTARENMSPALVSGFDSSASVFGLGDDTGSQQSDNSLAAAKRFIGTWSCGRCYITINNNGDGTYNADIKWSSSAAEGSAWSYICTYDAENDALVCNGSGINTHYLYTEEGQGTNTQVYNNGSAMFYTDNNGNLMWHDYYANEADGMVFTSC